MLIHLTLVQQLCKSKNRASLSLLVSLRQILALAGSGVCTMAPNLSDVQLESLSVEAGG